MYKIVCILSVVQAMYAAHHEVISVLAKMLGAVNFFVISSN